MQRVALPAFIIAIVVGSHPALALDDAAVEAYAMAFSAAFEAKDNCPGTSPNESALMKLERATGLHDETSDNQILLQKFSKWRTEFQSGIREKGASAWCDSILGLFGPRSQIPVIAKE